PGPAALAGAGWRPGRGRARLRLRGSLRCRRRCPPRRGLIRPGPRGRGFRRCSRWAFLVGGLGVSLPLLCTPIIARVLGVHNPEFQETAPGAGITPRKSPEPPAPRQVGHPPGTPPPTPRPRPPPRSRTRSVRPPTPPPRAPPPPAPPSPGPPQPPPAAAGLAPLPGRRGGPPGRSPRGRSPEPTRGTRPRPSPWPWCGPCRRAPTPHAAPARRRGRGSPCAPRPHHVIRVTTVIRGQTAAGGGPGG